MRKIILLLFVVFSLNFVLGAPSSQIVRVTNFDVNMNLSYTHPGFLSKDVVFEVDTVQDVFCRYSETKGVPFIAMENLFDENYGKIHKKILTSLSDGVYRYYVKCSTDVDNYTSSENELEVMFIVSEPIQGLVSISSDSPLKEGQYEVTLVTTKIPIQTPSLSFSLDSIVYEKIPLSGSGLNWRGYMIIPKSAGEKVGSFKFVGKDLEGVTGEKLTGDDIFLVDTVKPDSLSTIDIVGYVGQIRLDWFIEEGVDKFNIYKSENPNIDYTDFYKQTDGNYFVDNDVEKGKTYYYRVAGVDEAGNIADLSREVSATVLTQNTSSTATGLDISLLSSVENVLTEIKLVESDIDTIKTNINLKDENERRFFESLELTTEIDGASSELASLKRDAEKYKLQDLTKAELDKKLDAVMLKINVIKKKIPEDLTIIEEKEVSKSPSEENIREAILEYGSKIPENMQEKSIQESIDLIASENFEIKSKISIIEILYLDGTRKQISVVEDSINSDVRDENVFYVLNVPKDIAESVSEIDFKNSDYEVIKDDPVVSFASDTDKIVYFFNKKLNINSVNNIKLVPIKIANAKDIITGYSVFDLDFSSNTSIGIIILGFFVFLLISYFIYIKITKKSDKVIKVIGKIQEIEELKNLGKEIKEEYEELKKAYKQLNKKERKQVYSKIEKLRGK